MGTEYPIKPGHILLEVSWFNHYIHGIELVGYMTIALIPLYTATLTAVLVASLNYWFAKRAKLTDRELLKQYELNEIVSHLLQAHSHLRSLLLSIDLYHDDSFTVPLFPKSIIFLHYTSSGDQDEDDDSLSDAIEKLRRYHPTLFVGLGKVIHQWSVMPRTIMFFFQQMPLEAAVSTLKKLVEEMSHTVLTAINLIEPELDQMTQKQVRTFLRVKTDITTQKQLIDQQIRGLFPPDLLVMYHQLPPESRLLVTRLIDAEAMVKQLINREDPAVVMNQIKSRLAQLVGAPMPQTA